VKWSFEKYFVYVCVPCGVYVMCTILHNYTRLYIHIIYIIGCDIIYLIGCNNGGGGGFF